MLNAVFFDLDYTLQDLDTPFHAAVRGAFGAACREAGVRPSELETCLNRVWPGLWARFLVGGLGGEGLYLEWFARALPTVGIHLHGDQLRRLVDRYEACFEGNLCVYPDVLPALRALRLARPELRLGLVTNGPSGRQRKRAAALGIDGWFDVWVISEEVGSAKPDRRVFEMALARAGAQPADAVMVGDDPWTDVLGAKGAGIRALWVNRDKLPWPGDVGVQPDGVATDLLAVVALLRGL